MEIYFFLIYFCCIYVLGANGMRLKEVNLNTTGVLTGRYSSQSKIIIESAESLQDHGISLKSQGLKFSIKSCRNIHIFLSSSECLDPNARFLHITIRENNCITIRLQQHTNGTVESREKCVFDLLSYVEFRPFWLSWKSNFIQMGRGLRENARQVISWFIPDLFDVQSAGVQSDLGFTTEWIFLKRGPVGEYFCAKPGKFARDFISETSVLPSDMLCSIKCKSTPQCSEFNYNTRTGQCQLIQPGQTLLLIDHPDWEVYTKC